MIFMRYIVRLAWLYLLLGCSQVQASETIVMPQQRRTVLLVMDAVGVPDAPWSRVQVWLRDLVGQIPAVQLISLAHQSRCEQKGSPQEAALRCGQQWGAKWAVLGHVSKLGRHYSVSLKAYEVGTRALLAHQQRSLTGHSKDLLRALERMMYQVLAPEQVVGALRLEVMGEGIEIIWDGVLLGMSPVTRLMSDLSVGDHTLRLRRDGRTMVVRSVPIRAFETTAIRLK